jgi:predicted dehydrogenase
MGEPGESRRLGYALAGTGAIAQVHAEALGQIPRARLAAVYNRTVETARAFGEQWGVPWTTNFHELMARPDVDVISICTASGARAELAEAAARAGKHVVCEKPLEVTLERADRIIRACAAAGVALGVIFPVRYYPAVQAAKEALAAGRLGRLALASAYVKWHRSDAYYASAPWRGTRALDGGGALMNQAIHWIDLLLWLAGNVSTVYSYNGRLTHTQIEVEDVDVGLLRFQNGALGAIEATTSAYPGLPARVELHGDRGAIVLEEWNITVWQLAGADPEEEARMRALGQGNTATGAANPRAIRAEGHRLQLAEITTSLLAGRAPAVDGWEGRRAVELVCALYQAAATGREVALPLAPSTA